MKQLFEALADPTIEKVQQTYQQRGSEYADTWREMRFVQMGSAAKELGLTITPDQMKKLALAALVDIKYWRGLGGYKEDNIIDGIAYGAAYAGLMGGK